VQDQDGKPLQGIQVSRIVENEVQPMGATNLNGEISLPFKELPTTEIKLRLTQEEKKDYKDVDIHFSIPEENNAITLFSVVKVNQEGKWVVSLDSVKEEKAKITVLDDEGKPHFQIEPLVLTLECVYPDNTPIKSKEVKYNGESIGTTNENGNIEIKCFQEAQIAFNDFIERLKRFSAIKEAQNLTIDGYPLKKSGIDTKLELDIPCTTTLAVFVEDLNGKKIEGVEITTSGMNQAGGKVKKFSTNNGTDFRIYRLPDDKVEFFFSKENQTVKLDIQIKPDGSIKIVPDSKIARIEKSKIPKQLFIMFPIPGTVKTSIQRGEQKDDKL
jgi:hypothetical protein